MSYEGWENQNTWLVNYLFMNNKFYYDQVIKESKELLSKSNFWSGDKVKELWIQNESELLNGLSDFNKKFVNWQEIADDWNCMVDEWVSL